MCFHACHDLGHVHAAFAILITLFWEVFFSSFLQSRMQQQSLPDAEQPLTSEKQSSYARMQVVHSVGPRSSPSELREGTAHKLLCAECAVKASVASVLQKLRNRCVRTYSPLGLTAMNCAADCSGM